MRKNIFLSIMVMLIAVVGCSDVKKSKPAIKIGDVVITQDMFETAFKAADTATKKNLDKAEFLESYISSKLILNEAVRQGLDTDPEFIKSVQGYWERALLKLVLSKKIDQLSLQASVDDKAIEQHYVNRKDTVFKDKQLTQVRDQIKWMLLREKQKKSVKDWVDSLESKEKIIIDYNLLGVKPKKQGD